MEKKNRVLKGQCDIKWNSRIDKIIFWKDKIGYDSIFRNEYSY